MKESKLFFLILLLVLFMVSCSKILLIPITLIITGFLVIKKKYNLALVVLTSLFFVSIIFNNKIESFQNSNGTTKSLNNLQTSSATDFDKDDQPNVTTKSLDNLQNSSITDFDKDNQLLEIKQDNLEESQDQIMINVNEYKKLFFVFNALLEPAYLEKNKKSIDHIINVYKIKSIFDLSKTVLNRDKNPIYNNFLEKITCRNNGKVNYLLCDNINYKKMYAFCELLYVYTFDLDKIVELINKFKIMAVCELSANRYVLDSIKNKTSYGFEKLGLQYYLNEKSFTDKYYDILKLLKLDEFLYNDPNEAHLSLREKLYNYHNRNKEVVKDLNSIMVLFDYFNIFDKYILNIEDDDFNWNLGILKNVDLNLPCWEIVSYFIDYDVKERIIEAINRITSVDDEFLTRGDNPINPFANLDNRTFDERLEQKINQYSNLEEYQEETNLFSQDLNTFSKRFKEIKQKQVQENNEISEKLNTKINLQFIRENFSQKMNDITSDIIQLYSKKCNLECNDNENIFYAKFMYYLSEVFTILTKDDRMLFVGILFIIMSIIFNFILSSK